jgi:hydrogenase expression/formation protein HypE
MNTNFTSYSGLSCPIPINNQDKVVLGHGSGGKMTQDLINKLFLPCFSNDFLNQNNDATVIHLDNQATIAYCTDSHVVRPLFFPGGDIGRLAVCGTVNDLTVMGANPLYLTAGFIIEEGLGFDILTKVIHSMKIAAIESGVSIVAGDTKVVERGKADGLYINTSGIGILSNNLFLSGSNARNGDHIIVSGPIGNHGIAVIEARGNLGFSSEIISDVSPINKFVNTFCSADVLSDPSSLHVMRDPTRGGLATTLNEIAQHSKMGIVLIEDKIPIDQQVSKACELLGFDPLYVANEGKVVVVVNEEFSGRVLLAMRSHPLGTNSQIIGHVTHDHPGRVLLKTSLGTTRILDTLSGELLPRIC